MRDPTRVDLHRLNEARWAACNTRYPEDRIPTMEEATEIADRVVRAYLGMDPEEWEEQVPA